MPPRDRLTINKRVPIRVPVKLLNNILRLAIREYGPGVPESTETSLAFISPAAMRNLNKRYRNIDKATDVLSFSFLSRRGQKDKTNQKKLTAAPGAPMLIGEILIDPVKAKRQALALGHTANIELGLLFLHGLLHVLGFDHDKDGQALRKMEVAEQKILSKITVLNKQKGVIMRA